MKVQLNSVAFDFQEARFPYVTLGLACAALLVSSSPLAPHFEFSREAILCGEVWRLFTGHFTHWSFDHLVWDLASFVVLGAIAERLARWRYMLLLIGAPVAISLGLLIARPGLDSYRGLSGLDSALFVSIALSSWLVSRDARDRIGAALAASLLVGFTFKVFLEATSGQAFFIAEDATTQLEWIAHAVGGVSGLLFVPRSRSSLRQHQWIGVHRSRMFPF